MNHIFLNYQQIVNFVVDLCQKNVHFGVKDFVASLVVKDTMQVTVYVQGEDMEKEVLLLAGVEGAVDYQK